MIQRFFSPILIFLSGLLLLYTFYKSEIFWEGKLRDYYKVYYIFTITALFFSLITLFFSYKIKQYLLIIITSTVLGIYSVEFFLTMKKINNDKLAQTESKKKNLMLGAEYKFIKNLKEKMRKLL